MADEAVVVELLAVIRGDRDERVAEEPAPLEPREEFAQAAVEARHLGVVDVLDLLQHLRVGRCDLGKEHRLADVAEIRSRPAVQQTIEDRLGRRVRRMRLDVVQIEEDGLSRVGDVIEPRERERVDGVGPVLLLDRLRRLWRCGWS